AARFACECDPRPSGRASGFPSRECGKRGSWDCSSFRKYYSSSREQRTDDRKDSRVSIDHFLRQRFLLSSVLCPLSFNSSARRTRISALCPLSSVLWLRALCRRHPQRLQLTQQVVSDLHQLVAAVLLPIGQPKLGDGIILVQIAGAAGALGPST